MAMRKAGFNLPRLVGRTNGGVRPALRRQGEVRSWQRRFWEHPIHDQADFDAHVRHCWISPVKHGFVKRAADWPQLSIHRDIRAGRVEPEQAGVGVDGTFEE